MTLAGAILNLHVAHRCSADEIACGIPVPLSTIRRIIRQGWAFWLGSPNPRTPKMERKIVKSTTIRSIGYDDPTRLLEVQFTKRAKDADPESGPVYQFEGVEPNVVADFLAAESAGKFFAAVIKGNYRTFLLENGQRVERTNGRATPASLDYIRRLMERKGWCSDPDVERMSERMHPVQVASGDTSGIIPDCTVAFWLTGLTSEQASVLIDWLKVAR